MAGGAGLDEVPSLAEALLFYILNEIVHHSDDVFLPSCQATDTLPLYSQALGPHGHRSLSRPTIPTPCIQVYARGTWLSYC